VRVALIGNWPPPYGGVSVHVSALARALRAGGVDVRVLDIGHGDHRGPGVAPVRRPARYAAALAAVAASGRLVHLHTNGANAKSWLVALAAGRARRFGAPRGVLTIHSGSAPAFLRGGADRRRLAAASCSGYGAVVAVNEEIAAELAASGVPPDRVVVLPPFSPEVLREREEPAGLAAFRAARATLLAAAVAPGPTYGADLLLPAFAALRARWPGAGLVAFGAGTEEPEWRAPGVLGLGEIPHAGALAVLAAADVFVRPTRADGDALSVREALALGCTVVASDVGHRPAGCLLFPCGDGTALAARLAEAVAAPRPGPRSLSPDPFDALASIYRSLWAGRTLPDDGRTSPRASNL
jgi:glycosyltransferase involved in cell wall biosynthesis